MKQGNSAFIKCFLTICVGLNSATVLAQHSAHGAHAQTNKQGVLPAQNATVTLQYKGKPVLKAEPQTVSFELRENKTKSVLESGLETLHEKKIHVLVYDESLTQFFHVHPSEKKGVWTTESIPFEHNGKYFLWAEGKLNGADKAFNKLLRLKIEGGKPALPVAKSLTETLSGSRGNSIVTLKTSSISAKKEVMPTLEFSRNDGSAPQLTPYLGALAHVVIVPLKGDKLIHVHPMESGKANELMMHTTFPTKGDYRIWVQFIDGGELKVVPLAVRIK